MGKFVYLPLKGMKITANQMAQFWGWTKRNELEWKHVRRNRICYLKKEYILMVFLEVEYIMPGSNFLVFNVGIRNRDSHHWLQGPSDRRLDCQKGKFEQSRIRKLGIYFSKAIPSKGWIEHLSLSFSSPFPFNWNEHAVIVSNTLSKNFTSFGLFSIKTYLSCRFKKYESDKFALK